MTNQADPTPGGSRATRLRHARRVDWRFLMHEPALGDVALLGPPDVDLRAALEALAASVDGDDVDVAVLARGAGPSDVRAAVARVRPGGHLVAEAAGLTGWRPRRPNGMSARRLLGALRAGGSVGATAYIAWPAHGRTTALIPASDQSAVSAWVSRKLPGWLGRLAGPVARIGVRADLFTTLAPSVVVVARRPSDPVAAAGDPGSAGWLADRLGTSSFVALTPRFGASGHVVALGDVTVGRDGGPRTVLKVARLDDEGDAIGQEADALRRVEASLGADGRAPRPLEIRSDATPPYLVESGVAGAPLDPTIVRRDRRSAARAVADLVAAMPASSVPDRPFAELVTPALEVVRGAMVASGLGAVVTATDRLLATVADRSIPAVVEHGDLAHPNLVRTGSGVLGAVDWERARPDGMPLHDLATGLAYVAAAARGATGAADQAAAFRDALSGSDPWAGDLVAAELARLGVDSSLRTPLIVATWIRSAAWLATRVDPSTWLADRSVAHWRAMLGEPPDDA